jgi:hypothetical protein
VNQGLLAENVKGAHVAAAPSVINHECTPRQSLPSGARTISGVQRDSWKEHESDEQ